MKAANRALLMVSYLGRKIRQSCVIFLAFSTQIQLPVAKWFTRMGTRGLCCGMSKGANQVHFELKGLWVYSAHSVNLMFGCVDTAVHLGLHVLLIVVDIC